MRCLIKKSVFPSFSIFQLARKLQPARRNVQFYFRHDANTANGIAIINFAMELDDLRETLAG